MKSALDWIARFVNVLLLAVSLSIASALIADSWKATHSDLERRSGTWCPLQREHTYYRS